MVCVDRAAPIRFLRTAYDAADWVAVFLKTYRTGDVAQRVVPVSAAMTPHFQAWLRHRNANCWNVYVPSQVCIAAPFPKRMAPISGLILLMALFGGGSAVPRPVKSSLPR